MAEHAGSTKLLGGGQLGAALQSRWNTSHIAIGTASVTICIVVIYCLAPPHPHIPADINTRSMYIYIYIYVYLSDMVAAAAHWQPLYILLLYYCVVLYCINYDVNEKHY